MSRFTETGLTRVATNPESIGRFAVVRLLGRGGMGRLYLARDPAIGRPVAIKLLRDDPENAEVRERFFREARAAGGLRHPNIVTIFDIGEHDDQPFIAMEYVDGQTLHQLIRDGAPPPLGRRLELMEALCAGLGYAHRAGIVHRDVKPANVMVDQDGTLKILDFGIARAGNSGMTRTGMVLGTLCYMAPEQLSGEGVDHRSDIFAVGAVFYELVSGHRAFPGDGDSAFFKRLTKPEPEPLAGVCPDLDPEVVRIIETALQVDPARRYQDLDSMARDIARVRQRLAPEQWGTVRVRASEVGEAVPRTATPGTPRRPTDREELKRLRAARIAEHLAAAGRARAAGDVDGALAECRHALVVDPDSPEANDLFEQVRAERDDHQRRQVVDEADQALARGDLTEASALADRAHALGPSAEDVIGLRLRIDLALRERQVARERATSVRRAVERGRASLDAGEFAAAVEAADEALARDGAGAEAIELRREALAALERQRREAEDAAERRRQVAVLLTEVSDQFAVGELAGAASAVRQALAIDPAHDGAREWAERLDAAIAEHEAREAARRAAEELVQRQAEAAARRRAEAEAREAEDRARREAEVQRAAEAARLAEEAARREAEREARRQAEAEARAQREAEQAARREAEAARRAEADRRRAEDRARRDSEEAARREAEAARREAEARGRRTATPSPAPAPVPGPAIDGDTSRRPWFWWAAAALLVVAATAVIVRLVLPPDGGEGATGQVLVIVAPWGEIESVVSTADRREHLEARRATPCLLTLPSGEYVVRAANPHFAEPAQLTVRVEAGRTVRADATMPGFRVEDEIERVVSAIR